MLSWRPSEATVNLEFRPEIIDQYRIALTATKVKEIFGPYMYVKVCDEGGYTHEPYTRLSRL
jgi:hypothetical protein